MVDQDECREVWRKYFEKLLNEEFAWDRSSLEEGNSVAGPAEEITVHEVRAAISKMKSGKAVGPSGIGAEMLAAAGEAGVLWVTDICNLIVKEGRIPADWSNSWVVTVYKGKGDTLECGSYRGIKLLNQVMKVHHKARARKVSRKEQGFVDSFRGLGEGFRQGAEGGPVVGLAACWSGRVAGKRR